MPLPDTALDVSGGCNCGAIRYRVAIPPRPERPLHPLAPADDPVPLPFLVLDHCNDCRRATGSLLPAWLCAPLAICSASLVPRNSAILAAKAQARKDQPREQRTEWISATDVFTPTPTVEAAASFLAHFESSHERWRWFCARCGTNVAYTAAMPTGFPAMLDLTLGSVDRECLEGEAMVPERQLWWDYGIGWVQRFATRGLAEVPVHGDYRLTEKGVAEEKS